MTGPTPLSIAPTVAPSSSTGSDLYADDQAFSFGDISVGDGGGNNWVSKLTRDITVGVIVALAAKFLWSKI